MTKNQKNSKSGFTMVEIIAVLVIIGIMAAVAAPKFINMGEKAKQKAAMAGISEAKANLSVAYASAYLTKEGAPGYAEVRAQSAFSNSVAAVAFGDITVTIADAGPYTFTVSDYDNKGAVALEGVESWTLPVQ